VAPSRCSGGEVRKRGLLGRGKKAHLSKTTTKALPKGKEHICFGVEAKRKVQILQLSALCEQRENEQVFLREGEQYLQGKSRWKKKHSLSFSSKRVGQQSRPGRRLLRKGELFTWGAAWEWGGLPDQEGGISQEKGRKKKIRPQGRSDHGIGREVYRARKRNLEIHRKRLF